MALPVAGAKTPLTVVLNWQAAVETEARISAMIGRALSHFEILHATGLDVATSTSLGARRRHGHCSRRVGRRPSSHASHPQYGCSYSVAGDSEGPSALRYSFRNATNRSEEVMRFARLRNPCPSSGKIT